MINPNYHGRMYGEVLKLDKSRDGSLNITVLLISGHEIQELGFVYNNSVKVGDLVIVELGYSITSDRYGFRAVRKMRSDCKHRQKVINQLSYK